MRNTMKPIWKDWAKHKKPTKQIDILKIIASKGIQSETTLIEKLNLEDFKKLNSLTDKNKKKDKLKKFYKKYNSTVNVAISELSIKNKSMQNKVKMLQSVGKEKGERITTDNIKINTKPQEFYELTNNSINWLINFGELSMDEFLSLISNYFQNYTTDQIHIDELLYDYEKQVLKVDRKYFIPNFFNEYINNEKYFTDDMIKTKFISRSGFREEILMKIGFGKAPTFSQLMNLFDVKKIQNNQSKSNHSVFKNPKYYAYITENIPTEIENTIKELIDKKLIKELEIGSKTKYELTHLGFFELLYFLYDYSAEKPPSENKLGKLRKKYAYLLPDIFDDMHYDQLDLSFNTMGFLLLYPYRQFKEVSNLSQKINVLPRNRIFETNNELNNKYQILHLLIQNRQDSYKKTLSEYFSKLAKNILGNTTLQNISAIQVLEKLVNDDDSFNHLNEDTSKEIILYGVLSQHIKDRITFDFYLIYSIYFQEKSKKFFSKNKSLQDWFNNYLNNLNLFTKKYLEKEPRLFGQLIS